MRYLVPRSSLEKGSRQPLLSMAWTWCSLVWSTPEVVTARKLLRMWQWMECSIKVRSHFPHRSLEDIAKKCETTMYSVLYYSLWWDMVVCVLWIYIDYFILIWLLICFTCYVTSRFDVQIVKWHTARLTLWQHLFVRNLLLWIINAWTPA